MTRPWLQTSNLALTSRSILLTAPSPPPPPRHPGPCPRPSSDAWVVNFLWPGRIQILPLLSRGAKPTSLQKPADPGPTPGWEFLPLGAHRHFLL